MKKYQFMSIVCLLSAIGVFLLPRTNITEWLGDLLLGFGLSIASIGSLRDKN